MLTPTDLILIFLVSKPIFTGVCLLIIATRREAPEEPRRALPAAPKPRLLAHHD
jgi:hypothetical protein